MSYQPFLLFARRHFSGPSDWRRGYDQRFTAPRLHPVIALCKLVGLLELDGERGLFDRGFLENRFDRPQRAARFIWRRAFRRVLADASEKML
jgi:hypothetical protein